MQEPNPLFDPESPPIMPSREQASGLGAREDMNLLDLLAPSEQEKIEEVGEEPPWIAEFLGQHRLVFGNSIQIAPALTSETESPQMLEPASTQDRRPDDSSVRGERTFAEDLTGPANAAQEPLIASEGALPKRWTRMHLTIATTLIVFATAFILMFFQPQKRQVEEGKKQAPPITESQTPNEESMTPVSPSVLPFSGVSSEDVESGIPIRKVLPIYPRAALAKRLEGNVALEADISRDGKVSGVRVLSGDPILAQAATEAVRQWTYPASASESLDHREQRVTIHFKAP